MLYEVNLKLNSFANKDALTTSTIFIQCNRQPWQSPFNDTCLWKISTILGLQPRDKAAMSDDNTIEFFLRIYLKIELSSQRREMLLFLPSNMAQWRHVQTSNLHRVDLGVYWKCRPGLCCFPLTNQPNHWGTLHPFPPDSLVWSHIHEGGSLRL